MEEFTRQESPMASRQYQVKEILSQTRPSGRSKSELRRRVRARLTRLEDGHELVVSMIGLGNVGDVVSLEDDHIYLALWKSHTS
jgi:hypothetical protein